ncbi:MAG: efflux RND transporter permease subunit, partial [Candidatus Eremiobacteraeota bacterium]|nr:efflux RND transporter permease subunit [Candidatus Eremiobacteraeota bacterium]MBV8354935.1 efflux RND transporter permease subunit [Candidatus Eremiobacteraeota bacterium]
MTSLAFIIGVTPLVFASGAGSEERHSLGTAVFGGMIVSTFLNLVVIPVMYVLLIAIEDRVRPRHGDGSTTHVKAPSEHEAYSPETSRLPV